MPSSVALSWRRIRCCILAASAWVIVEAGFEAPPDFAGPGDIEIQFAPMDIDMSRGGPDELMNMLAAAGAPMRGSPSKGAAGMQGPPRGGREAELDNMLANVLGSFLGPDGGRMSPGGRVSVQSSRGSAGPGVMEEVVMQGPSGTQVMMSGGGGPGKAPGRSSLNGNLLRDLFPGAMLAPGPMVIDGPAGGMGRSPFGPDPLMMDIMQDLDRSFSQDLLPAIQKAASAERDPASCTEDVNKFCTGAKSHLHCLGTNHDSISEACRKEVGQSVPYRCSKAISTFCDVLEKGILACLYDHMDGIDGQCRDAVLTTKHVINKVNTQQASLVDPSTGVKKVSTPTVDAAPKKPVAQTEKEATLDLKLGLTQTVPARSLVATPPVAIAAPAVAIAAAQLQQTAQLPIESAASGLLGHWHGFGGFFFVALIAFGVYLLAFTDYTKQVQARLHGREGSKLLNTGMELPRPDSM